MQYKDFLKTKIKISIYTGARLEAKDISPILYPHQRDIVRCKMQKTNKPPNQRLF
jgi:hypothetical protein